MFCNLIHIINKMCILEVRKNYFFKALGKKSSNITHAWAWITIILKEYNRPAPHNTSILILHRFVTIVFITEIEKKKKTYLLIPFASLQ